MTTIGIIENRHSVLGHWKTRSKCLGLICQKAGCSSSLIDREGSQLSKEQEIPLIDQGWCIDGG